ncbi:MAG: TonB-dependent receptor [Myxococcales bacterium]|nr:TonB-dependent receptor [Myxococcales bacterium]
MFIGGASSLENRWTLDGAPIDSPRTAGAETRLPLAFLSGLRITTGGFSARDSASSGGVIDAELLRGGSQHQARAQAWLGALAQRQERPIVPGTFSPLRGQLSEPRTATVTAVASGPLGRALGGDLWYAAGVAPTTSLSDFELTGQRMIDRNGDGAPDLRPDGGFASETISRDSRDATSASVPMMARAGLVRAEQRLDLTLVGLWSQSPRFTVVATPEASEVLRRGLVLDGVASWRRRWRQTALHVQLSWHHSARREVAADDRAGRLPQLQTAYLPDEADLSGLDPRFAAACRDGDAEDRYPALTNCPVPTGWFARQGVGQLSDAVADRPALRVDAVRAVGAHALRAGLAGEDTRLVVRSRFSGGLLERSLFAEHVDVTQFVNAAEAELCMVNIDVPCPVLRETELTFRTRHVALYLEDTWRPRADLLVDVGVRWEYQQLGSRLRFGDNVAPRLGVAWDPVGGGRSRVAATFGRLFTHLPAGLGERIDKGTSTVSEIMSPFGRSRVLTPPNVSAVTSGVDAMVTDEAVFSIELVLPRLGQLRLRSQHRWLRAGFEDTAQGFTNPSTATRRVDLVGAELATSPHAALGVRAGYAFGQAVGSLVGAYDPRRGVVQYASRDFDELSTNHAGPLPSDLGHRFYSELSAQRAWRSATLELGARMVLASGRPRNLLADSDLVGSVYLLPRGSAGRLPGLLTTDLRVAGRWSRYAVTLQLFNVFSRQVVAGEDEVFSRGDLVLPIDGGDASDLPFFKDELGGTAARSPGFRTPTSFQLPISGFLGIEATL